MYLIDYGLFLGYPVLGMGNFGVPLWDLYYDLGVIETELPNCTTDFIVFYRGIHSGEVQFVWEDDRINTDLVMYFTGSPFSQLMENSHFAYLKEAMEYMQASFGVKLKVM